MASDIADRTSPPLLSVRSLTRRFGSLVAVDGVDLEIHRGQVVGLLGPNGAGKSSTLALIAGCLQPTAGSVLLQGEDVHRGPRALRRRIGYLPDQPPLYPELRVDEFLDHCLRLRQLSERQSAREQIKADCGLQGSGRRIIGRLSRGWQQRVGLAQALIHGPELLLLDEPTVALDPLQLREVRAIISAMRQRCAVLLSTHILAEVEACCTHVAIMSAGRILAFEPLDTPSSGWLLRFRDPPALDKLAERVGQQVRPMPDGDFYLPGFCGTGDELAGLLATQGWGLERLSRGNGNLEQRFLKIFEHAGQTSERGSQAIDEHFRNR